MNASRRVLATLLAGSLAAACVTVWRAPDDAVRADSQPADPTNPATPTTVAADALPTVQIDGVVWTQAVVGNTVFVGGNFTNARPAGAAPGTNLVPRSNFLAYDIGTGELITTIAPAFNAQVRTITASPDGTRLYVGGDFTTVDGLRRDRLAAFELPSMRLIGTFLPPIGYHVWALSVSPDNSTLYVGGNFNAVGSQTRNKLAALRTTDGALLNWAPNAQGGLVSAIVVSPDGTKVAVGGRFTSLNGSNRPGYGLGAVDAVTGALVPWAVNNTVRNGTDGSGITSLATDGTSVYGTGFATVSQNIGNFEGTFSASWNGGTINWLEDCHGDTYSVRPQGDAIYIVGHPHFCGNIGGFPQTGGDNSNLWTYHRALGFSRTATGTVAPNTTGNYASFGGQPAPSPLLWYPDFDQGTFTGQNQGPWNVSGNADYVVIGGEFRNVNNSPQQGLVRFAVAAKSTNKQGPRLFGSSWVPTASSTFAGVVRLSFGANWDRDNATLTYRIERDGRTVGSTSAVSSLFSLPTLGYTDTTATPGSTATYRVVAVDPFGNEAPSQTITVNVSNTGVRSAYGDTILATTGLVDHWRLGEASGTFADPIGSRPLTLSGSATRNVAGAIPNDPSTAVTFTGGRASTSNTVAAPQTFSIEAWVRTSSTQGGKIIGSDNNPGLFQTATPDRHLYLSNDGRVNFGVNTGSNQLVTSTAAINDNRWHHVVGTVGGGTMRLYVDGVEVANRSGIGTQRAYNGVWRVGGGALNGWTPRPSSDNLNGTVDEAAVYNVALDAATVARHWQIGSTGALPNQAPTASFTVSALDLTATVNGSASSDPDGSIASWAWNFGDNTTGTGATTVHAYAAAGTYTITLTVTDDRGATAQTTRSVTVTAPPAGPRPFATDAFERTVANGFGTADLGGAWTIAGTPANFAVGSGTGRVTMTTPGSSAAATVTGANTDTEVRVTVGADKLVTGGSLFTAVTGRRVGTSEYRAKLRVLPTGATELTIVRTANGAETTLVTTAVTGLTLAAGERVQIRFQATGTSPTTLRAKVWKVGTPEPAAWLLTTTDSTADLQAGGGAGVWVYLSSAATNAPVVVSFDDFWAGTTA
ncbi:MAG: LamG-like jellyroll fold domain-containing protein [Acidimicrobiales bacterium]